MVMCRCINGAAENGDLPLRRSVLWRGGISCATHRKPRELSLQDAWCSKWNHSPRQHDEAVDAATRFLNWAVKAGKLLQHHCHKLPKYYEVAQSKIVWAAAHQQAQTLGAHHPGYAPNSGNHTKHIRRPVLDPDQRKQERTDPTPRVVRTAPVARQGEAVARRHWVRSALARHSWDSCDWIVEFGAVIGRNRDPHGVVRSVCGEYN